MKWLWEMLKWLWNDDNNKKIDIVDMKTQFENDFEMDVNKYTNIMTYINNKQQNLSPQVIDLSPQITMERINQRLQNIGLEPSKTSPQIIMARELFGLEEAARIKSTKLKEDDIAKEFAKALNVSSNEDLKPKIAAAILEHATSINDSHEKIILSNIKMEEISIELHNAQASTIGGGPSMQYKITYPALTPDQIQKIADIYFYHYPAIDAKSQGNTLILEAHVLLEKVIPFIQKPIYRPAYIENPKTFEELAYDAGLGYK